MRSSSLHRCLALARMAKKIIFPLISLFLAYRSVELVRMFSTPAAGEFSLLATFLLALALNLFITGVFAFVGFAYPSSRLLPDAYYRIENQKALQAVYGLFGLKYFRTLLLMAYWGKEKNRKKYFNGTRSGLRDFDHQTRQSEFGHLGAFVAIAIVALVLLSKGHVATFAFTTAINVLGNLYPIVLQRMHRMQIGRMAERYGV